MTNSPGATGARSGVETPGRTGGGPSDGALVRASRLGDRAAFGELFARHSLMTFRYAVRMLEGDHAAAQDVAQESWIKAWQHLDGFRGESAFRTWLLTIVVREVYSARRRRRPIPVQDERLRAYMEARQASGDQDPSARAGLLADALSVELLRLPWRQREVWLLREVEDLSYGSIAEVLDVSETVVRGQLHRARRTLSIRMEPWR